MLSLPKLLPMWWKTKPEQMPSAPEVTPVVGQPLQGNRPDWEQRLRKELPNLAFLDGVFAVVRCNDQLRFGEEEFALEEFFADTDPLSLNDALQRVHQLLADSHEAALAIYTSHFHDSERVTNLLAARHPGFSRKSVVAAIDYGLFHNR